MTLGWSLFLWATIVWLAPIMYLVLKNECKPKKNIIVGVVLPVEAHQDPAVLAITERFKRELKYICWLCLAAVVPCLAIRSVGAALTAWMVWAISVGLMPLIPYVRCNKALRKLKAERGWRREERPQVVTDLTAAAAELRWLSPWWFLPPLLIGLVPLLFDRELWWLWASLTAMIPISYACYRYLYRSRAEVVDEDSRRTLALTRIRRYNWGKCWLILAWATGLFGIGLWAALDHPWLSIAVISAYGLIVCAAVIRIEFRVRKLQEKLGNSQGQYVDEDDQWIWGFLYYAPNDRRMLVNDRVGMNVTFNLARRPAQFIMALILAFVLACPLFGVWLIRMERAPVELEITQTELVASHLSGEWRVALEDIQEVQLLDTRPPLQRVAGTGMDNALTGTFRNDQWGRFTCCIDPRMGPWLLIAGKDGRIYLFGSSAQGEAERISAALAP